MKRLGRDCAGGFATHCLLPAANARPSGDVDGSIAVMAEPFACALHGVGRLAHPPRRVAVLGHGPLGALVHLALRLSFPAVEVVVAEPRPRRAKLAVALGAIVDDGALVDGGFDAVLDTAASADSIARALRLCADGGRAIVLAEPPPEAEIRASSLIDHELVICASQASCADLPRALALIVEHPHLFRPLITEAIELSQLPEVLRRESQAPSGAKVVVRP
jgi:threonine dehydrogenase-like Zn-dependent dehydrogenase